MFYGKKNIYFDSFFFFFSIKIILKLFKNSLLTIALRTLVNITIFLIHTKKKKKKKVHLNVGIYLHSH